MTIEGTKKSRKRTILEGKNAKGELGAAQNGIEAISVDGLVLKNMWARNYQSNGFFVHAAVDSGQHCDGYTMDNLLASGNRSYGLFAKNCFGGKMINSAGFHHGDSAFYVGETPCDEQNWTNHGVVPAPKPCQTQAAVDAAEERPQLRKRARLLRHELQVREDHRIRLLQQRRRDRAQHARQRGLRAERLERLRTQRRVLEQLQLLPRRLGLPHRLGRARRARRGRRSTTRPASGSSSTAATTTWSATTTSSATTSGASPPSPAPAKCSSPTRATTPRTSTTRSSKTGWAATAPTRTANTTSGTTPPAAATAGPPTAPTRPSPRATAKCR